jgi:hypothetical protein
MTVKLDFYYISL